MCDIDTALGTFLLQLVQAEITKLTALPSIDRE